MGQGGCALLRAASHQMLNAYQPNLPLPTVRQTHATATDAFMGPINNSADLLV
jgi:hypothetical protein